MIKDLIVIMNAEKHLTTVSKRDRWGSENPFFVALGEEE